MSCSSVYTFIGMVRGSPPPPEIYCWYGTHTNLFNQLFKIENPTVQHGIIKNENCRRINKNS